MMIEEEAPRATDDDPRWARKGPSAGKTLRTKAWGSEVREEGTTKQKEDFHFHFYCRYDTIGPRERKEIAMKGRS